MTTASSAVATPRVRQVTRTVGTSVRTNTSPTINNGVLPNTFTASTCPVVEGCGRRPEPPGPSWLHAVASGSPGGLIRNRSHASGFVKCQCTCSPSRNNARPFYPPLSGAVITAYGPGLAHSRPAGYLLQHRSGLRPAGSRRLRALCS
jgi:hypothetical protein